LSPEDFLQNPDFFYKHQTTSYSSRDFKYNYLRGVIQSQQEAVFGICW